MDTYRNQLRDIVNEWGMLGTLLVLVEELEPHNQIDLFETAAEHVRAPRSGMHPTVEPETVDGTPPPEVMLEEFARRLERIMDTTENTLLKPEYALRRCGMIAKGVSDHDL